jgi:hypothetical protein
MPSINERPRGFFTIAQNSGDINYIRMAYALALSLKKSQLTIPFLSVGITPGTHVPRKYAWAFDNIIEIPWGDAAENSDWKLENEWKVAWMTPYQETIKLDTDMLFFSDISGWWEELSNKPTDICWTNSVLDWKGSRITSDFYRKAFTENKLPNIYTAFMYFRKNQTTYDFFDLVKMIYWNWQKFFEEFLLPDHRPDHPSTDVIFALAAKIADQTGSCYPISNFPTFTHMKSRLQGWKHDNISEDWREYLPVFFNKDCECRLGNHLQFFPLHYHLKDFLTDEMINVYEESMNNDTSMD